MPPTALLLLTAAVSGDYSDPAVSSVVCTLRVGPASLLLARASATMHPGTQRKNSASFEREIKRGDFGSS